MSWSFCPWCGHRTYEHGTQGCEHAEKQWRDCGDPQCGCAEHSDTHQHEVTVGCDCKHPHTQMLAHAG